MIEGLNRDKSKLEVEYEKLLTINETLAADLELAIRQKKCIEEEQVFNFFIDIRGGNTKTKISCFLRNYSYKWYILIYIKLDKLKVN